MPGTVERGIGETGVQFHPILRGINHIVQVVRRPADLTPFVSESYPSGPGGIRLTPLAGWLEARTGDIHAGRAWAVDPFAMAHPGSGWVAQAEGAGVQGAAADHC